MWPDRVSNPGSLTYESAALPTVLALLNLSCFFLSRAFCIYFCCKPSHFLLAMAHKTSIHLVRQAYSAYVIIYVAPRTVTATSYALI